MSNEKMREAFEAFVRSKGGSVMKRYGHYIESMTRLWLDAWQAATAATQRDAMTVAEAVRTAMVQACESWPGIVEATKRVDLAAIVEAVRPGQPIKWEWQHPDDTAVDRFQLAMRQKMADSRAKGRSGWDDPEQCSVEYLAKLLVEHLTKGNTGTFVDVANFAMMLHQRGADPRVLARAAQQPMADRYSDILKTQREECERAPSDAYMFGLYNGMLMMCCNVDGTDFHPIYAAPAQQQGEPVAGKFFAYDDNVGFDLFDTADEAKKAAQESIDEYRAEAGDGWADEVERVCWGAVLGTTKEIDLGLPEPEYDGSQGVAGLNRYVDYILTDTAPPAPACSVPDEWRDIESAPKDGRTILLGYFNSHGNWRTLRGRWFTKEHIDDNWEDGDLFDAGWYETSVEADDVPSCWPTSPTHWMPTPVAPKGGA